jgi:cytoskeletal protein CcmA (bactofilin family)
MVFGKSKATKIATVIGEGTEISGNIIFSGGLHVDGRVKGNVQAEPDSTSALTLSEKGVIDGDIHVPNVIVNGEVNGDVYGGHRVELAPKARVTGTVYYNLLEMAMGASVNGQLIHAEEPQRRIGYDGGDKAKAAKPAATEKPATTAKPATAAKEDASKKTTTIKGQATMTDL